MVTTSKTTERGTFSPTTATNCTRHRSIKQQLRENVCPPSLPEDLDVIKEFIQHDKDDDYIPLISAIALKK